MKSIYLIGFIQTVFFTLLILTKKKLKLSDVFLFSFILLMGLRLLGIYLYKLDYYETYPLMILVKYIYWPLLGPVLYLYICALTEKKQRFKPVYLIHFTPAVIMLTAILLHVAVNNLSKINEFIYPGIYYLTGMFTWFLISIFYFIISTIKLHRFKNEIKHYFSYTKNVDLKWLLNLTYGFGLFLLISLIFILSKEALSIDILGLWEHITWVVITLYIFGIGFYGFKQKKIFTNTDDISVESKNITEKNVSEGNKEKYVKTRLDKDENDELLKRLTLFMEKEKPYLDSELNLLSLSESIQTSSYKLSQVINYNFNVNFFEYINKYRIEDAKKYLMNPEFSQEKIMNIAYDCGFNSKSSFFSIFKKYTSQTPSEYKKRMTVESDKLG